MPMAVARDIDSPHDAAMPTTASLDTGLSTPTPHGKRVEERDDENKRMESPPGYEPAPQHGYLRPGLAESDEDFPSGRVNAGERPLEEDKE